MIDKVGQWNAVRSANSTDSSFPTRAFTATKPSSDGVIDLPGPEGQSPRWIELLPFGTDAADEQFDLRLLGWMHTASGLWVNVVLGQWAVTLGDFNGVSGHTPDDNQYLVDTFSLTHGNDNVDTTTISPEDDTPGYITADLKGHKLIEVLFKQGASSPAASMNALYKVLH